MPQKPDLRRAMHNVGKTGRAVDALPIVNKADSGTGQQDEKSPHFRPGREGKSNVTGYFPAAVKKQLRLLAAERETTIQDLLGQALNDLFAKHGKPEIAPVGADESF